MQKVSNRFLWCLCLQNRNQEAESYLSFRDHRYKRKGGGNAAKKFINGSDRSQTIITRKKALIKNRQ